METQLVSVIIPVYNSSEYLERCLDSIIKQTYSELEIILIDDGSDDGSLLILKEYEKKDKRIHVAETCENRGQSAARNTGLRLARGEWIIFVDSDDDTAPDMVEYLLRTAVDNNAQICVGSYAVHNETEHTGYIKNVSSGAMPGREAFGYLVCDKMFMIVCACIFRKELFENHIFPEGRIYEDSYMFAHVLLDSGVCVCTDKIVYHYYKRGGGTALGSSAERRLDQVWVMHKIEGYAEKKAPEYVGKLRHITFSICTELLERIYSAGINENKKHWIKAKEEFSASAKRMTEKYFWERAAITLFNISPVIFIMVRRVYRAFIKVIPHKDRP